MIGKIYVEDTMYHCNIRYNLAYKFTGNLDFKLFDSCTQTVLSGIEKFSWEQVPDSKGNPEWCKKAVKADPPNVAVITCTEIDHTFAEFSRDIFSTDRKYSGFPLFFTVLHRNPADGGDSEFMIIETINHAYADGRSAELVFNKICDLYLAEKAGDRKKAADIVASLKQISTIPSSMVAGGKPDSLIRMKFRHRLKNMFRLITYKLRDEGKFSIPFSRIKQEFEIMKNRPHELPVMKYFDINPLVTYARSIYPEINPNAVICSVLTRAMNRLCKERRIKTSGRVSFRMMSDILSARARTRLMGNYSAYMPVTADGSGKFEDTALQIHEWVSTFRAQKIDASMYNFLEFATRRKLIGKQDDPISFTYTLVINRRMEKHPDLLGTAHFTRMIGSLNCEPRNPAGAMMNNKIMPAVTLSRNNVMFVTFYPLPVAESSRILNSVADAIGDEIRELTAGIIHE
jgi:hypothetical protein